MDISVVTHYIRPELMVAVVILYCIGMALQKSSYIRDNLALNIGVLTNGKSLKRLPVLCENCPLESNIFPCKNCSALKA